MIYRPPAVGESQRESPARWRKADRWIWVITSERGGMDIINIISAVIEAVGFFMNIFERLKKPKLSEEEIKKIVEEKAREQNQRNLFDMERAFNDVFIEVIENK